MTGKEVIHILNDLITINKNRITGYKEIMHELKEEKAIAHCREMIRQSEKNNGELAELVRDDGGEIEDKTTTAGIIYNTWMDIVYSDEKESREDIYNFCRQMEKTTAKGYEAAIQAMGPGYKKEYDL